MAIDLPAFPLPKEPVSPRLLQWSRVTTPAVGGAVQKIRRIGDRWAVDVTLPKMDADCAKAWIAAWLAFTTADNQTVRWTWPQKAGVTGLGSPRVNGGGQAGSALVVDGLTAGVTVKGGTFFSFVAGGRAYLEALTADVTANGSGQATLPIGPMMRGQPADNALLNFTAPVIEGFLDGGPQWTLERLRFVGLSFTLSENE